MAFKFSYGSQKMNKIYTQKEFDSFEIDVLGNRICPSGDYRKLRKFGDKCKFNERCQFDEGSIFGKSCTFLDNCYFDGKVKIGAGSWIKGFCYFLDIPFLGEGCHIGSGCVFKGKACSSENPLITFEATGIDCCKIQMLKCNDGVWVYSKYFSGPVSALKDTVTDTNSIEDVRSRRLLNFVNFGEGYFNS